ncbi:MAG: tol-pal system YbgF family protein [Myxococcales bacterium]|nr:tetratricopeptide repeat protein [Myxococcales bacterium]
MIALLTALTLTLAQADQPGPDKELPSAVEAMNRARVTFEYGDYPQASKLLSALVEGGRFESLSLRAEAYRLLGLALFYQGRKGEAYSAFLEYLYLEPDGQLDPFYVPPAAVSFFDQVKKEAEPKLVPIRAQKRAEQEARQKAATAEAERRRQRELEEERRRLQQMTPPIERRIVQHEFWVSMMPFGIGQLQNGDRTLGMVLATAQVIAGASSAGSALLIEELRDPATGKFSNTGTGSTPYRTAVRLNVVKWVGAGVFFALWAAGAIHAAIHFQAEEQLPDRLIDGNPRRQ